MLDKFNEILNRLNQMSALIQSKATGDRKAFASHLKISESQLSLYITYFRANGVQVEYDRLNRHYYFQEDNEITFSCGFIKVEDKN